MSQASFLQRLVAWLIDQAIISIISSLASLIPFAIAVAAGIVTQTGRIGNGGIIDRLLSIGIVAGLVILIFSLLVIEFLYFGYFWSRRDRTIGMGLLAIKVVKRDGSSLSFFMAGLRGTLGYYLSGLVFFLGYLWFFVDEKQETWHDKIFGTTVLKS